MSGNRYFLTIEEMFDSRPMTFDDISHLSVEAFQASKKKKGTGSNDDSFQPSDILNIDEDSSDDEILKKFSSPRRRGMRKQLNSYLSEKGNGNRSMDPGMSYRDEYGLKDRSRNDALIKIGGG